MRVVGLPNGVWQTRPPWSATRDPRPRPSLAPTRCPTWADTGRRWTSRPALWRPTRTAPR